MKRTHYDDSNAAVNRGVELAKKRACTPPGPADGGEVDAIALRAALIHAVLDEHKDAIIDLLEAEPAMRITRKLIAALRPTPAAADQKAERGEGGVDLLALAEAWVKATDDWHYEERSVKDATMRVALAENAFRAAIAALPRSTEGWQMVPAMRLALSDIMLFITDEHNASPENAAVTGWWKKHAETLKHIPRPGTPEREAMLTAAPSPGAERRGEEK